MVRGNSGSSPEVIGNGNGLQEGEINPSETVTFARLNLRQKLAVVRRRISLRAEARIQPSALTTTM